MSSMVQPKLQSDTLKVGDFAPDFQLCAANFEDEFSLAALLQRGPLVIEFLRGTW
jgi:peroxiredoxin